MRRLLLTFAAGTTALAFAATGADAQTIGAKLGASFSTLTTDAEDENIGRLTGFVGGGFVRFDFGRLGIQTELLTVTKGATFEGSTTSGVDDVDVSLEYVEIPVLLHMPLSMGPAFAPYVLVGPAFAFEVGCESDTALGSFDCDGFESTDIGLAAGGGLAFAMGPGALLVEGRYTWGMTNLIDDAGSGSLKNRSAYLMAGYSIPLSRPY